MREVVRLPKGHSVRMRMRQQTAAAMESAMMGGGVRSVVAEGDAKRRRDEMRDDTKGAAVAEVRWGIDGSGSGRWWWWVRLCVRVCERGREGEGERGRVRCAAAAAFLSQREVGLDQFDAEEKEVEWAGRGLGRRCTRVAPATRRSIHVPLVRHSVNCCGLPRGGISSKGRIGRVLLMGNKKVGLFLLRVQGGPCCFS
jgi:hypothetical protein